MANPKYYNYKCPTHGVFTACTTYDERDVPKTCELTKRCKKDCERTWEGASTMVFKESYHDGIDRKGFKDMKEASKLEIEMMSKPVEDRKGYKKAIKKLKET